MASKGKPLDREFVQNITESERRILTLLSKVGPLSKRDLMVNGHMSWATVVKMINRLQEQKLIRRGGTSYRTEYKGKNAYLYELSSQVPLAVGIDIEYTSTNIILTNLSGQILASMAAPTPANPSMEQVRVFTNDLIADFLSRNVTDRAAVAGIGIGIPGIAIPSWLRGNHHSSSDELKQSIEAATGLPVIIDNNIRAYAVFEKWDRSGFSMDEFVLISIRTGIGSGIFIDGVLYRGSHGMAGELGHFPAVENGKPCRCGKRGCLETVVNQHTLYEEYRSKVLGSPRKPRSYSRDELMSGLSNLFRTASEGNAASLEIVNRFAAHLGKAVANVLMTLDIPNIIISGFFGEFGRVILHPLEEEIRKHLLSKLSFTLSYYPFDEGGFTRGPALMILKSFLAGIPRI